MMRKGEEGDDGEDERLTRKRKSKARDDAESLSKKNRSYALSSSHSFESPGSNKCRQKGVEIYFLFGKSESKVQKLW